MWQKQTKVPHQQKKKQKETEETNSVTIIPRKAKREYNTIPK